jgi:DNA-binding GntR family transcriptional regulator
LTKAFLTKTDHVVASLRGAIERGEIKPGDWIRAEVWAKKLDTSATPVREALRRLEANGVVTFSPHRGAQVMKFTKSEFLEVYRMRAALEALAVELVIERLDATERARLCERLAELQKVYWKHAKAGQSDACRKISRQFHLSIYEAAGSPRLVSTIRALWDSLTVDQIVLGASLKTAATEHDAIVEAIRRGRSGQATNLLKRHLAQSAQALLRADSDGFFAD